MIHQHPRFEKTPIVFVSGIHVTEDDRLNGYKHGAVDYIPVPVTPDVLRAKVRVFADLHRKTRQLELLNERITSVQEEERRRVARELHDSVGQLLVAVSMNNGILESESDKLSPDGAKVLSENTRIVEEISKQVRTISYLLHPPLLDEVGIASALRCYVEGFSKRSKIDVKLEIAANISRFSPEIEICVFRLVQECLTNVHRHSGSPDAAIRVERNEAAMSIEVEDSGRGMSLEEGSTQLGVGLPGMQERLRRLGGRLQIQSNESGTKLTAVIPLHPDESLVDKQLSIKTDSASSVRR
jgi:signal transduction histidine kinase